MAAAAQFSKPLTRKDTELWLIGQISDSLSASKLASKKEVMSLFFHYKANMKQIVHDAAHATANDVLDVWNKARIPTRLKKHVVDKEEGLFREYAKLKKTRTSLLWVL